MDVRPWGRGRPAATDLAKAIAFQLGPITVDPPARRVSVADRSQMLEPRVMRVLVALGETPDLVLSREDLIELCWDGQIVSDNAINRVISLLRRSLEHLGDGVVRLETITKVGFRVVVHPEAQWELSAEASSTENGSAGATLTEVEPGSTPPGEAAAIPFWRRKWARRGAVAGVAATGAGALFAFAAWRARASHVPDPRALDLYGRGQLLLKSWEPGSIRQAIAFNKQAVEIDPEYADAWGALAIAYIHGLDGLTAEAKVAYPRLVRSAAERALALDHDQAEAHFALAIPYPHYRRWLDHERRLRSLVRRFDDYWYGHTQLAILLSDVGRFEEAIVFFRRAREIDPMVPIVWGRMAHALQQTGRDQEADLVLDEALGRWPEHVFLWITRSANFIEGRRFPEAVAFSRDSARRPLRLPDSLWQANERVATALATGEGAESEVEWVRKVILPKSGVEAGGLSWLAALGAVELALDAFEAYYLGGVLVRTRYPPPGPLDKRPNLQLLSTYMLEQREHPRFKALLERTGLEEYWRNSGRQPDFRRR